MMHPPGKRTLAPLLLVLAICSSAFHPAVQPSAAQIGKSDKRLQKVAKLLNADSVSMTFGLQPGHVHAISYTTGFYHEQSRQLYYVLTVRGNRSFHIGIPTASISSITTVKDLTHSVDLRVANEKIVATELNDRGGTVYHEQLELIRFPLASNARRDRFIKLIGQRIQKSR